MKTDEMVTILEEIARDEDKDPSVRCTAVRTLPQIEQDRAGGRGRAVSRGARGPDRAGAPDASDGGGQRQPEAQRPLVQTPAVPAARANRGDDPLRLPDLPRPASARSMQAHPRDHAVDSGRGCSRAYDGAATGPAGLYRACFSCPAKPSSTGSVVAGWAGSPTRRD